MSLRLSDSTTLVMFLLMLSRTLPRIKVRVGVVGDAWTLGSGGRTTLRGRGRTRVDPPRLQFPIFPRKDKVGDRR